MNLFSRLTAHSILKPLSVTALIVFLLASTSCKNSQRQASANIPPTSAAPSLFPEEGSQEQQDSQSLPPLVEYKPEPESSAPSNPASTKKTPPAPKPFALRTGEKLVNHTAVSGDNLWKLARDYGTTVSRIKSANGLTSEVIYKGKVYKIPTVGGRVVLSEPKPSDTVASSPPPATLRTSAPPAPAPISTSRVPPAPTSFTQDIPSSAPPATSSGGTEQRTFQVPIGSSNTGSSSFPRPTFGSGNY